MTRIGARIGWIRSPANTPPIAISPKKARNHGRRMVGPGEATGPHCPGPARC